MQLTDFYFESKAVEGTHMVIPLPNGQDSGEWLNVIEPSADAAQKANMAFLFAYQAKIAELEPLKKDKTKYAVLLNEACEALNLQLAMEVVNGWSFDEPFSREALAELLRQYKALANVVAAYQSDRRKALQEK